MNRSDDTSDVASVVMISLVNTPSSDPKDTRMQLNDVQTKMLLLWMRQIQETNLQAS